jgi:branched-chain amino acid transport system ATP-binding protein
VALLEVRDVRLEFGGIVALDELSFDVEAHQVCALIGPNGAGKTTLFNCVSRVYTPTRGSIRFVERELTRMEPHEVASAGVARTFQNIALFPKLTVLENVMCGAHSQSSVGPIRAMFGLGTASEERRLRDQGRALLARLSLEPYADRLAAGLPYGTLKRIEIARSLASAPRLLLLDEPAAGLTHAEVDELAATVRGLREEFDLTIVLVEHHMGMVMGISDHVVVLDLGRKIAEGAPAEIARNERVIAAYLGTEV